MCALHHDAVLYLKAFYVGPQERIAPRATEHEARSENATEHELRPEQRAGSSNHTFQDRAAEKGVERCPLGYGDG